MVNKRVPKIYYGLVWIYDTVNLSVSKSKYAKGRTEIEIITC